MKKSNLKVTSYFAFTFRAMQDIHKLSIGKHGIFNYETW